MKFMVLVKASKESEAGQLPTQEDLLEMGRYNEELVKAGVVLDWAGLQASSKGARVTFDGEKRSVTDGPFAETKELVAGYSLWQCKSKDEALEWIKRAPFRNGEVVELRQVFEPQDFAPVDPDGRARAQGENIRRQTEALRR